MQNKPIATTTEAGRAVYDREQARKQATERRADTTTPLDTLGKAPLEQLPEPPAFTRQAARRPIERPREPLLQWATGLATADKRLYAGWFVEVGTDTDLDNAMDAAQIGRVQIRHGAGNVVTHWALETASLFVICDGVQSMTEMRESVDRFGIAFGWRENGGKPQSVLNARVLVQELCAVGYTAPLLLSLKSTLTSDLLACLIRHYTVLDSINPIRKASGKPPIAVPYYAVAVRLGAGDEVQRGSSGQSKEITPMIEVGERDRAYVLSHWCKREWVQAIEGKVDETILWSRSQSVKIASGGMGEGE